VRLLVRQVENFFRAATRTEEDAPTARGVAPARKPARGEARVFRLGLALVKKTGTPFSSKSVPLIFTLYCLTPARRVAATSAHPPEAFPDEVFQKADVRCQMLDVR
jgi:hypothetical protein